MKQLTNDQAKDKTILALVGRGKSTFVEHFIAINYYGIESVLAHEDEIKNQSISNKVIFHLESEEDYNLLNEGLKRRTILFKIDF